MTLRQYLAIMSFATLLCTLAWGMVVWNVDPYRDSQLGLILFYITFFFSLMGIISLFSFGLYRLVTKSDYPLFRFVQKSFRNGVVGASFVLFLLILQVFNILNIWTGIMLLIVVLSISFFQLSSRAHDKPQS